MSSIARTLREHIHAEFMFGDPTRELTDDTELVKEGIIDSLGIFLLIEFAERELGVKVDPKDVTLENFATVASVTELIGRHKTDAG